MITNLTIIDNIFPHPEEVRAFALTQDFSVAPVVDGHAYKGFSQITDAPFGQYLTDHIAQALGLNVSVKIACVVMGTAEPTQQWIHADNPAANFAGVIYLFDRPNHGTAFWKHVALSSSAETLTAFMKEWLEAGNPVEEASQYLQIAGTEEAEWTRTDYAESKFNRLIVYPTDRFHSRWPREAFGTTPENCRLTISVFFDIVE